MRPASAPADEYRVHDHDKVPPHRMIPSFVPAEAIVARRVLYMVECLHRRGYERLRIAPAWSPSGTAWRCAVAPREAFEPARGARLRYYEDVPVAHYTSGMGAEYFGWPDVAHGDPEVLTDHFIERFPEIVAAGRGADGAYAAWFTWMLRLTAPGGVPFAVADWPLPDDVLPVDGAGALTSVPLPPSPTDDESEPLDVARHWFDDVHPAELLWQRHREVEPYPPGVWSINGMIPGTAFAPGGAGLVRPKPDRRLPDWPAGGVMVLGHNFDSAYGYERSFEAGEESERGATWRRLRKLLHAAAVELEACYFTNAFAGVIAGESSVGEFPGARDAAFTDRCLSFLCTQLSVQRPRAMVVLGRHVPPLLARLSPDLTDWAEPRTLAALDRAGRSLVHDVRFPHDPAIRASMAVVAHPSFAHVNQKTRSYGGATGAEAEVALVRAALAHVGAMPAMKIGPHG